MPFGGSPLEAYPWTSGESNHHRQSVRVAKNDALPTEPRGRLYTCKAYTSKKMIGNLRETSTLFQVRCCPIYDLGAFFDAGRLASIAKFWIMDKHGEQVEPHLTLEHMNSPPTMMNIGHFAVKISDEQRNGNYVIMLMIGKRLLSGL